MMECLRLIENEYLNIIKKDFIKLFQLPENAWIDFERLNFRFTSSGRSLERVQITDRLSGFKKNYIIKTTAAIYPEWEVKWSKKASEYGFGPRVIYGDERREVIIEEDLLPENNLRNRAKTLEPEEIIFLARKIAEKFFRMLNPDEDTYYHKFDKFVEHTFITGKGEEIDIKWVDWGKAGKINQKTRKRERQTVAEFHLRRIFELFSCWFDSPEGLAEFIIQLRKLAGHKSQKELDFYDRCLQKVHNDLITASYNDSISRKFIETFKQVDTILTDRILNLISKKLGKSYISDPHHGLKHAEDLIEKSCELLKRLNKADSVDVFVLTAAIALHDVKARYELHGRKGARFAEHFLRGLKLFSTSQIEKIKKAIRVHEIRNENGRIYREAIGIESQILFDVDNLDALGIKGIYRYIVIYSLRGKSFDYIKNNVPENVKSRFENLTFEESKEIGKEGYEIITKFFDKLEREKYSEEKLTGAVGVVNFIRKNLQVHPSELLDKYLSEVEDSGKDFRFAVDFFEKLRRIYSKERNEKAGYLDRGWVIANHILVSFHVAFISSVFLLTNNVSNAILFIFGSFETLISAVFWYIGWHSGIALHEMGHYLKAAKLYSLNKSSQKEAEKYLDSEMSKRILWYIKMFLLIPWGRFNGVKKYGKGIAANFTYDGPYNLAVAAAGPAMSRKIALITLPLAIILLSVGLIFGMESLIYAGRFFLVIGCITALDFKLADPGKYTEFREREKLAKLKAEKVKVKRVPWLEKAPEIKNKMIRTRLQEVGDVRAPWQFRNCGMGGRHTEKEYPESNLSMQEAMFVILNAKDYEEAQKMTVELQNRLKEIIEKNEGCRVIGIGLEGGLASYIREDDEDVVPELKLWRLMVQAIEECGYVPGEDVAIALDPAASELEKAYREEFDIPDSVGMYLFWRSEKKVVMTREEVVELYKKAIEEGIPIISIEDGLSEEDYEGWKLLMDELGDKIFIIGDDLITTKDSTIEECAKKGLINSALIKANQIGTLTETIIGMLVALAYNLELVISHRSKSPNDIMEAEIACASNALGLKAGGGANTERLVKYGAIIQLMRELEKESMDEVNYDFSNLDSLYIKKVNSWEEATNAGIPTVAVKITLGMEPGIEVGEYTGSTPLGTSAGSGEAIHLVDSIITKDEEIVEKYPHLFILMEDETYRFRKDITLDDIEKIGDRSLLERFQRAQRYSGKGVLNAVENAYNLLENFTGKSLAELGDIIEIDRFLLKKEIEKAIEKSYLPADASKDEKIEIAQRKGMHGMNAILSCSLALARLLQVKENKKLYRILRDKMTQIALDVVNHYYKEVGYNLSFEEAIKLLQEFREELEKEGELLYPYLREATKIYVYEEDITRPKTPAQARIDELIIPRKETQVQAEEDD